MSFRNGHFNRCKSLLNNKVLPKWIKLINQFCCLRFRLLNIVGCAEIINKILLDRLINKLLINYD